MIETLNLTPELLAALSEAQGEIENAEKNANNPHFRSKYADLAEIINTVRPVFAKHGLSMTQAPHFDGSLCSVTTMVAHKSGGFILSTASCVPAKSDAQGIGSATTYLRRYSAAAMAGIAQEDDDGNSAAHDRKPEPLRKSAPAPRPAAAPRAKLDENNQNVVKLRELRAEIMESAKKSGVTDDPKAWADNILKDAANSLQLSLKPGDVERISEGAISILVDKVRDAASDAMKPEAANA